MRNLLLHSSPGFSYGGPKQQSILKMRYKKSAQYEIFTTVPIKILYGKYSKTKRGKKKKGESTSLSPLLEIYSDF